MIGIITPLGGGRRNRLWLNAAATYTVGGVISSCVVGFCFWAIGVFIRGNLPASVLWRAFAVLATLLALRDLGVIAFPLPERKCQAPHAWLRQYGLRSALFMWGLY